MGTSESDKNDQKVVVIDVGHGIVPYTTEKTGFQKSKSVSIGEKKTNEFEINLKNAEFLREELEKRGYTVILTTDPGERDGPIAKGKNFTSRQEVAVRHHADLYISMHANYNRSPSPSGIRVCLSEDASTSSKKIANELIETFSNDSFEVGKKPYDLTAGRRDGPLHSLKKNIPGVLIEAGFMSNKNDLMHLTDDDFCKNFTASIANGVDKFFGRIYIPQKNVEFIPQEIASEQKKLDEFLLAAINNPLKKPSELRFNIKPAELSALGDNLTCYNDVNSVPDKTSQSGIKISAETANKKPSFSPPR